MRLGALLRQRKAHGPRKDADAAGDHEWKRADVERAADEIADVFAGEAARALGGDGDPASIVQRVYVAHGGKLSVLLGDAGDPAFARRVKDAIAPVAERNLGLGGDPFAPYYFEFAISGILAAATLWYGRGRELDPSELGQGIRAIRTCQRGRSPLTPVWLSFPW